MYRNILPYNIHRDNSHVQGHNSTSDRCRLQRVTRSSLARSVQSGARRMNKSLRRSINSRAALPTMSWWD